MPTSLQAKLCIAGEYENGGTPPPTVTKSEETTMTLPCESSAYVESVQVTVRGDGTDCAKKEKKKKFVG